MCHGNGERKEKFKTKKEKILILSLNATEEWRKVGIGWPRERLHWLVISSLHCLRWVCVCISLARKLYPRFINN